MVLEVIYIVRHGYRSNWTVDAQTGQYSSTVRTPTGNPADPALAAYGVIQAEQLATHLKTLDPAPDKIYSSPYYRCLQTLAPWMQQKANDGKGEAVTLEPGMGEFYGLATFEHPRPSSVEVLSEHFDFELVEGKEGAVIVPSVNGETIPQLHDRVAYCLSGLVERLDKDPSAPKAVIVCTHAAAIIATGRVLTGRMPEDVGEEDFKCFTAGLSKFVRRNGSAKGEMSEKWNPDEPSKVPDVRWRDGRGVSGGWDCEWNSNCSFLQNGEERGWNFYMEQQRIARLEAEALAASSHA